MTSRSSSPSLRALNLRPPSLLKALSILGIFILIISYSYWSHLVNIPANFIHRKVLSEDFQFDNPTGQNWTHRIWQTSKEPVVAISAENREHVKTWSDLNPDYRHEVLTDEMMESYVKDHFHVSHPDIEKIYFDVKDYILRSDLIRYLILLADGGVYNDLDVGCQRPISNWVPQQYKESAGILLGVEVDNKFGPDGRTFNGGGQDLFQLVNWTIMSKPNQPFMWFLVKRVMHNIRNLAASQNKPVSKMTYSIQNVLDVTGPAALTRAFFDYASDITGSNVTYHNFTKITKPRLIGEVVILPIQAFGAGHQVKWAGWEPDGTELIHHYFAGSWKTDHYDSPQAAPPSVDEEQKKKESDAKKAEEAKRKQAEEEKKKQAEEEQKKQEAKIAQEAANKAAEEKKKAEAEKAAQDKPQETGGSSTDAKDSPKVAGTDDSPAKNATTPDSSSSMSATEKTADDKSDGKSPGEKPTSDKPTSVQYVEDQTSENTSTGDKPAEKESMKDKIDQAKAEKEAKEKEDAEAKKKKEAEEKEKNAAAAAKHKATEEELAAKKKEAIENTKEAEKAQEEAVKKADEDKWKAEEDDRKKKWEDVKAAAPKTAPVKQDWEKMPSNNLGDYDYQPD